MGSTAVAALVNPPEAAIAWVGDSRAYIFDGRALRQLSKDHSLVQRLIEIGQITPVEAAHHEHAKRTGRPHLLHRSHQDDDWHAWFASYMAAEQAGTDLPS